MEQYCKHCMYYAFSGNFYGLLWRDLAGGCKEREAVCSRVCVCVWRWGDGVEVREEVEAGKGILDLRTAAAQGQ